MQGLTEKEKSMYLKAKAMCKEMSETFNDYKATPLEAMSAIVAMMCSVSIGAKKTKSEMVELLGMLLNNVPADAFYEEEDEPSERNAF